MNKTIDSSDRYDIILIGTGAGGGTLAYRLAPTGKKTTLKIIANALRVGNHLAEILK